MQITVDPRTRDNENQSGLYKLLGGEPDVPLYFGVDQHTPIEMRGANLIDLDLTNFLQIRRKGVQEKKVDIGNSQDVRIDLKVRSVQINRPWIDLSALKIQDWRIPGEGPGAWSTGVLDSSNNGSFPLLSTRMIVARDITVTASCFSKEIISTLKAFDPTVESAELVSYIKL